VSLHGFMLLRAIEKRAEIDRAVFKGFADRVFESLDDKESEEPWLVSGRLSTDPGKFERPPRASYARQDPTRSLVDHAVTRGML